MIQYFRQPVLFIIIIVLYVQFRTQFQNPKETRVSESEK